jgi:hypothetical protein
MPGEWSRSKVPFVAGILATLAVLALRAPVLYSEPTVVADDVRFLCVERGAALPHLYRHLGAVHALPMALSWVFANTLPLPAVFYAYSLSSLLLAAIAAAVVLHPIAGWLPLWPGRVTAFALLAAVPVQGRFLVASLAYQHLSYFVIAAVLVVSCLAPTGLERVSELSRAGFALLCVLVCLCIFSAPMSPCLVVPIALAKLMKIRWSRRQSWLACVTLGAAASYAVFCLDGGQSAVALTGLRGTFTLVWQGIILFIDRVAFEPVFGLSAKLMLHVHGAYWVVYLAGIMATTVVIFAIGRAVRRGDPAAFFAAATLATSVAVVVFSVLGRAWIEPGSLSGQFTNMRYFAPPAILWFLCVVTLLSPYLGAARVPAVASGVALWVLALNSFDNVRYSEPIAVLLAENPDVASLRELPRGTRERELRDFLRQLDDAWTLERSAAPKAGSRDPAHGFDAICSQN